MTDIVSGLDCEGVSSVMSWVDVSGDYDGEWGSSPFLNDFININSANMI